MSSEAAGMKQAMKIKATVPNANAIGMPENITNKVTATKSEPNNNIDMINGPLQQL
jgi:hypothetical protein